MIKIFDVWLPTAFLYFVFYSVFGWVLETIYCSVPKRRFVKRGFLMGPICPIYGMGAMIIILPLSQFKDQLWLFTILAVVLCTALEYLIGWQLEVTTGMKYWDYSRFKFNIKGRVCLWNSVLWGVLAYAAVFWIHPQTEKLFARIPMETQKILAIVLAVILILDMAYTCHRLAVMAKLFKKLEQLHNSIDIDGNGHVSRKELIETIQRRAELHSQSWRRKFPMKSERFGKYLANMRTGHVKFKDWWAEQVDNFRK